jgi:hypothetical protein
MDAGPRKSAALWAIKTSSLGLAAFDDMDVVYARYQDDLIILCKTRSQFNRCRRKLMNVLKERRLELSRKKSRFGELSEFHFLGISYSGTRTPNNTTSIFDIENRENKVDNTENREQRTENREQRTENREQRTENREQRTENREQRTENRFFAIPKFIVKNLYECHFMHEHFVRLESK